MTAPISPDDVRELVDTAQAKLASARHLLAGGYFGDASSRAYYAVYHILTAVLATAGVSFSSHAQVLGAYNREFIHSGLIAEVPFAEIQRLFNDRQKGDYATMLSIDEATASSDIKTAARVLDACTAYLRSGGHLT